jgi:hypothetical protein
MFIHTETHTYVHTYTHAYIHTHIHACIYIYIYMYIRKDAKIMCTCTYQGHCCKGQRDKEPVWAAGKTAVRIAHGTDRQNQWERDPSTGGAVVNRTHPTIFMCVCVREREREWVRKWERERERFAQGAYWQSQWERNPGTGGVMLSTETTLNIVWLCNNWVCVCVCVY